MKKAFVISIVLVALMSGTAFAGDRHDRRDSFSHGFNRTAGSLAGVVAVVAAVGVVQAILGPAPAPAYYGYSQGAVYAPPANVHFEPYVQVCVPYTTHRRTRSGVYTWEECAWTSVPASDAWQYDLR